MWEAGGWVSGGSARIHAVDGEGRPVHLAIFMQMLMEGTNPRKTRPERAAEIKGLVTSICLAIGVLWEGTRGDPTVWELVGALQVGTLKATAAKRRHRISRTFKRQLTHTARNAIGLVFRTRCRSSSGWPRRLEKDRRSS